MTDERKPWGEPGMSIEERAAAVVHAVTLQKHGMKLRRLDTVAEALRATRADALEDAARINEALAAKQRARNDLEAAGWLTGAAGEIRALKDAP